MDTSATLEAIYYYYYFHGISSKNSAPIVVPYNNLYKLVTMMTIVIQVSNQTNRSEFIQKISYFSE